MAEAFELAAALYLAGGTYVYVVGGRSLASFLFALTWPTWVGMLVVLEVTRWKK